MNSRERRQCERRERRAARRARRLLVKERVRLALDVASLIIIAGIVVGIVCAGVKAVAILRDRFIDGLYKAVCVVQQADAEHKEKVEPKEYEVVYKGQAKDCLIIGATKTLGTVTPAATRRIWRQTWTVGSPKTPTLDFAGWYDIEQTADGFEYRVFRYDGTLCESGTMSEADFFKSLQTGMFEPVTKDMTVAEIAEAAISDATTRNHPFCCGTSPHPLCRKCQNAKESNK